MCICKCARVSETHNGVWMSKHANMLCRCVNQSEQGEWRGLFAMFASLSLKDETMSSECESWLCHSTHHLPLVTQVTKAYAFFSNTSSHFNFTFRMFLQFGTMSCGKVDPGECDSPLFIFALRCFLPHCWLDHFWMFTLTLNIPRARYSEYVCASYLVKRSDT